MTKVYIRFEMARHISSLLQVVYINAFEATTLSSVMLGIFDLTCNAKDY